MLRFGHQCDWFLVADDDRVASPVAISWWSYRGYILVVVQRSCLSGSTEVDGALVEVHHSSQVCHLILKVVLMIQAVLEIVIGLWLPLITRNACFGQCPDLFNQWWMLGQGLIRVLLARWLV